MDVGVVNSAMVVTAITKKNGVLTRVQLSREDMVFIFTSSLTQDDEIG